MDKLTMYNATREALLASFSDNDFIIEITKCVWDELELTIGTDDEVAIVLFDECYTVLVQKMVDAIK